MEAAIKKFCERFIFGPWANEYLITMTQRSHSINHRKTGVIFGSRSESFDNNSTTIRPSSQRPTDYATTRNVVDATGKVMKRFQELLVRVPAMKMKLIRDN